MPFKSSTVSVKRTFVWFTVVRLVVPPLSWYISDELVVLLKAWKVSASGLNVATFTVSENVRWTIPIFMSRSNDNNVGGVTSLTILVTLMALSCERFTTWLVNMSAIRSDEKKRKVSFRKVARLVF